MNDPFLPIPTQKQRGIFRWVLMLFHGLLFAGVVFGYPLLLDLAPDVFDDNIARLGIPVWGLLVVAHVVLVAMIDVREGIVQARRDRRRRQEYMETKQQIRQEKLKSKTRSALGVGGAEIAVNEDFGRNRPIDEDTYATSASPEN